jgi:hypothetical protein
MGEAQLCCAILFLRTSRRTHCSLGEVHSLSERRVLMQPFVAHAGELNQAA